MATQPGDAPGSMNRYGELVTAALSTDARWIVRLHNLALPFSRPAWLPAGLYTWLNHLWLLLTGRWRLRRSGSDLLHLLDGSYAYVVPARSVSVVATVHDLIPWLQRQGRFGTHTGSAPAGWLVRRALGGLRRCAGLLADSENTATDLVEQAGFAPSAISVVPIALAPVFLETASRGLAGPADDGPRYVLHVGNNAFYKNRAGVLRVFARLQDVAGLTLFMAGAPPDDALLAQVRSLGLDGRVEFITAVDDGRLVQLYSGASLFLFPSLYEGFGWPPLEAMACGCPVVCSSEGSLPGVAGPAALMAPADDEVTLAALCQSVLSDAELAARLSREGRVHAGQFTRERMGRHLAAAYLAVLGAED